MNQDNPSKETIRARPSWKVLSAGFAGAASIGALLLWGGPGAHRLDAQTGRVASAVESTVDGRQVGEVDVYGQPVLRIRSGSGGYSAFDRAEAVAARLNDLADRGELGDFSVGTMSGQMVVLSKGHQVITATDESARDNSATPAELAKMWADNLSSSLNTTQHTYSGSSSFASDTQNQTLATAREVQQNGKQIGEVDVYGKPVLQLDSGSGGYSPYARAQAVARRLNDLGAAGKLKNIRTGFKNGEVVVLSDGGEIITASQESARYNGSTPNQLATQWASNLNGALQAGGYTYGGSRQYGEPLPPEEHNADKLVPILAVGTGTRLGVAVITGPSSQVAKAVAVGQIEGKFKRIIEGRALVPISNPIEQGLHRVPEVSVYAVGDYRIP